MEENPRIAKLQEAVLGALIGGAVGDALGMPAEGLPVAELKEKYGHIEFYLPGRAGSPLKSLRPGQFTDDTQMVIATINALTMEDGYTHEKLAVQFKALQEKIRGAGKSTYTAIQKLNDGVSWKKSGDPNGIGSGAITRIWPFYFCFINRSISDHRDEEEVITAISITHKNPTVAGIVPLVMGLVEGLYEKGVLFETGLVEHTLGEGIAKKIDTSDKNLKNLQGKLLTLKPILDQRESDEISDNNARECIGTEGTLVCALPMALYCFLKTPSNYEQAVVRATNMGGDTDSIAALTGIFSGVYNGISAIPDYLKDALEDRKLLEEKALKFCKKLSKNWV